MYVCLCKGITEEKIESMLRRGLSEKEILKHLGVGSECGICLIDGINQIKLKLSANKEKD